MRTSCKIYCAIGDPGGVLIELKKNQRSSAGKSRMNHRKILLLGSGIEKSISPSIHQKALAEVGFSAKYELCDVPERAFETKLSEIKASEEVLGFNITIPYKEKILPFIKAFDEQAKLVGAVNTVKFDTERNMSGFNTDIDGVVAALACLGFTPKDSGKKTVILGAGGAARACAYAAVLNGFNQVILLNRTKARARAFALEFGEKFSGVQFDFSELSKTRFSHYLAGGCDLLINSIPSSESFPFATEMESAAPSMKYFDVNYRGNPPLMRAAEDLGLEALNGLLMLVEQAARSFEIWTGVAAPRKTMMLEAEAQVSTSKKTAFKGRRKST